MRSIRPALAAASLAVALALTATACQSAGDPKADAKPTASASKGGDSGADEAQLPDDLDGIADRLKEHGIDVDKWKNGEWKNWDKDKWLREAKDFANPVIKGLWSEERKKSAKDPQQTISSKAAAGNEGVTDPEPRPVRAEQERKPYWKYAAPVGKIFFDTPEGTAVCSGTVVKDPRNPGKSNLVWTAGHCVHAGQKGGWYRNIVFTPAYNHKGLSARALESAGPQDKAPYGEFWADWISTSNEWIDGTTAASPDAGSYEYDYAVLHVKPERGNKSLEETIGTALPVDFSSPSPKSVDAMGAWGYPQAPPYDGALMHKCVDRPGRLSLTPSSPTMYRIGCTMTAGSSGGGWFRSTGGGKLALVSNTSIGPAGSNGWLAGPQLGDGAKRVFDTMSEKYGSK
ncbi:trypsin-like serine peptidase [Streptomyces cavernicola]|uniref:Secreted protein n=1 Tax=Streptomyces cavernicola TaxID=3043613 RepID=A0ABT6S525_9ACTN|nr:hypothetical protein [Streptomyces sp. B-S-A6]MDI3402518.1 hypothetical protein [Streptomyces sp. B-S-A6]